MRLRQARRLGTTGSRGRRSLHGAFLARLAPTLVALLVGGCLEQRCYEQADCDGPQICDTEGRCVFECTAPAECPAGFTCEEHHCVPEKPVDPLDPLVCPDDMVVVADTFCIDRHEASRPDASSDSAGTDDSLALSVEGVMPWQVVNNAAAAAACDAAGKRLCSAAEWHLACTGPDRLVYAYGDTYEPTTCNGIDTFGRTAFHLMPTGSFPDCTNEWGAFDLNGNLWEHVANGSDMTVRGGAYNCGDSAALHRCDYIPGGWSPSARGFRCCADGSRS